MRWFPLCVLAWTLGGLAPATDVPLRGQALLGGERPPERETKPHGHAAEYESSVGALADEPGGLTLTVAVTEAQGVYSVSARLWVPAPPATVWAVLTDYDHVAGFTHDIQASRLVERRDGVCIVEQRGRGILGMTLRVRLRVIERPPDEIRFEALDGDFRVYRGAFRLTPQGEGTEVAYALDSQGKFWIPPWIGRPLIRGRVRRILEDIAAEVLRRQAGP